jgi:hypothetical protein
MVAGMKAIVTHAIVAWASMLLGSCASRGQQQPRQELPSSSILDYKSALLALEKQMSPNNARQFFVEPRLICWQFPISSVGFSDTLSRLAGWVDGSRHINDTSIGSCTEDTIYSLMTLASTDDKRYMIMFSAIDSTSFEPLKIVTAALYDSPNRHPEWTGADPSGRYFFCLVALDPVKGVVFSSVEEGEE